MFLPLLLLFLLWPVGSVEALISCFITPLAVCSVSEPDVVLGVGTNGTVYLISTNRTWAQVNVTAISAEYYENVLAIIDQSATTSYKARLENPSTVGISFLSNFTVYLHDGNMSKQVEIIDGAINQSIGSWCDLSSSSSIYVSFAVEKSSGSSIVDLRLHIVEDGTESPEFVQTIRINID
jgi:hypothetical protein